MRGWQPGARLVENARVGPYRIINSYHCSRLNTNTGRLTAAMFEAVIAALAERLAT